MSRQPRPIVLWAAVIDGPRASWINWLTVRRTRKLAREAYLSNFSDPTNPRWLENTRFVRVIVTAKEPTNAPA